MPAELRQSARRLLRAALALGVLVATVAFLARQVSNNLDELRDYPFRFSASWLCAAVVVSTLSFLLETYAWQWAMNRFQGGSPLRLNESVATVNTSGLLKYLPGRVWTYAAQMLWLAKRGIPKAVVLYVNLLCMVASLLVAITIAGGYVLTYLGWVPGHWLWACHLGLGFMNVLMLAVAARSIGWIGTLVERLRGKRLELHPTKTSDLAGLQLFYGASSALMGVGGYCLAAGIGIHLGLADTIGMTAAMSVAGILGYVVALTPGGLGVREALMFAMLQPLTNPSAALILPLASRLLYMVSETILGVLGVALGLRLGTFTADRSTGQAHRRLSRSNDK